MQSRRVAAALLLLLAMAPLAFTQQVSEKKDLAVFRLSYYQWDIPDSVLGGIDEELKGVFVNIGLLALNLLPVPPLDGGRILTGLLPHRLAYSFARIEPYGLFIVLGLMATNTLGFFLRPFYKLGLAIVGLFV